jgi:acetyl esterase/lipase
LTRSDARPEPESSRRALEGVGCLRGTYRTYEATARDGTGGCLFFPPTDITNFGGSENIAEVLRQRGAIDPSFLFHDVDQKTGARTLVTDRETVLRMLREFSPVTHVTADDPPTILIHGDTDKAVPLQQSRRLIDRLHEVNVPARLVVREGMGHAWSGWEADTALMAADLSVCPVDLWVWRLPSNSYC